MLTEGQPEVAFAFVNKPLPESRGTADMVKRLHDAGIPIYVTLAGAWELSEGAIENA
jgi:hypothetical protein